MGLAAALALAGAIADVLPIQVAAASKAVAPRADGVPGAPGAPWGWGDNGGGEMGNGTDGSSGGPGSYPSPTQVAPPSGVTVTAISAGFRHVLALTSSGQVLAWGLNQYGELGNGSFSQMNNVCNCVNTVAPVNTPAGTTFTAVAAGFQHSLALTSTGQVLAWGTEGNGQLGNGIVSNDAGVCNCQTAPVPVSLPAGTTVTAIASGGSDTSLALTSTGALYAWGYNSNGQLGNGTTSTNSCQCSSTPVQVSLPAGTMVTAIAEGGENGNYSLALTSTGKVLTWGANGSGQLGNGTNNDSNIPVQVSLPSGTTVTAIAGGGGHSLALTSTGTVLTWGSNGSGQLGNGTNNDSNTPVLASLPSGTTATAVAGGSSHSLALTSAGNVLSWGANFFGMLGNGTTNDSNTPAAVSLPSGTTAVAITAGFWDGFALLQAPTVTSISPNRGPAGTAVTITGTHLTGATAVTFGTTPAASFTVVNDTTIQATSPPGTLGTAVDVTVTTPLGTGGLTVVSGTTSADLYTYALPASTLAGVVGGDNALYVKQDALAYQGLGGILLGAPAVVSVPAPSGPNSPLYVVVGGDHRLYVRGTEAGWADLLPHLPLACYDNPAAAVTGTGPYTLTVACQGGDQGLYYWQMPVTAGSLPAGTTSFTGLGGAMLAGPAVTPLNGTLTYFVEGLDHRIYSRTAAAGSSYAVLPAACIGHPAAATNAAGTTAYLACQGLDGALYYSVSTGSGFTVFHGAGGQLIDGPGIAVTQTGVTIFVEGLDTQMYHTVVSLDGTSASPFTGDGGGLKHGAAAAGLPR